MVTAASTALPPVRKTAAPASAASTDLAPTIPPFARASTRSKIHVVRSAIVRCSLSPTAIDDLRRGHACCSRGIIAEPIGNSVTCASDGERRWRSWRKLTPENADS